MTKPIHIRIGVSAQAVDRLGVKAMLDDIDMIDLNDGSPGTLACLPLGKAALSTAFGIDVGEIWQTTNWRKARHMAPSRGFAHPQGEFLGVRPGRG